MSEGIHLGSVESFWDSSAKVVCTPLKVSIHLFELNTTQSESKKEYMSHVPYASVMSRYTTNPRKEYWQVMKHIFRYLNFVFGSIL